MRIKYLSPLVALPAVIVLVLLNGACGGSPAQRKSALVASAEKYQAAGEYGKAVIEYKNALKLEPESAQLHYALGRAYFANAQYEEAYLACQKAIDENADFVPPMLLRGRIELKAQELVAAGRTAQKILDKHPDNVDATILLADSYAGRDATAAVQILEKLVGEHPDLVPAHLDLGVFYISQGRLDAGRDEFEKAIALDPKSIDARKNLANFYSSQGKMAMAEEQYQAAVQANPDSAAARRALADFFFAQRRWDEAEKAYQQLAAIQHNSVAARFTLGRFYVAANRREQARAIFEQLAHESPDYLPARLQLGELALQDRRYDEADQIAVSILKTRPKDPDALLLQARAAIGRNDPAKAIPVLEAAQRLEPNIPALHYWKGVAYHEQGNLDLAQHSFEQAIGLNEKYIDAQVALAGLMMERGLPDAALRYAQQALQEDASSPAALLLAGNAHAGIKDYKKAEGDFEQYIRLQPNSAEGPLRLGAVYLLEQKLDAAEQQFERSLALDPKQIQALSDILTVDRMKGQSEKAIARLRQQIALGETADLDNLLGLTYLQLKQYPAAEAALKRALQVDPNNFRTYVLLGALYGAEKAVDKVIAEYEVAVKLHPGSAALWTALGNLDQAAGKVADAQLAYQKALDADSNAAVAANNLAWLYCQQGGDLDKALELANRARQLAPDQPGVADTLAWIYYKRNLFDSAIPLLKEAVRQEPGKATYRVHLAASLLGAGQKEQARTELNAALRLDGSLRQNQDVRTILASL